MTTCRASGAIKRPSSNRVPSAGYHLSPTLKVTEMFARTLGGGGTVSE